MKKILILFFSIFSIFSFSQNIKIIDEKIVVKSRHTKYFCDLSYHIFSDKYAKIRINGDFINDSLELEQFKINILNSDFNKQYPRNFMRADKFLLREEKRRKSIDYKETNYNNNLFIKRKTDHYIIKLQLRSYSVFYGSVSADGYDLSKGNYYLNVEYHVDGKIYRSENVPLIVK